MEIKIKSDQRLNPQQARFVAEYVKDSNGQRAAIDAGYSKNGARVTACKLLTQANIQAAVDEQIEAQTRRTLITADKIVQELGRIALADPISAFNDDGSLKSMTEIPEDLRRAIAGIDVDELWEKNEDGPGRKQVGYTRKLKFWNKNAALDTLSSILQLLKNKFELTGKDGSTLTINVVDYSKAKQ